MKTLLCFVLFAAAHNVWACKCDTTILNRLQKDPTTAKTAFIATAHVKRESQFFQVTHALTAAPKNVDMTNASSCRFLLENGKRYLVLAGDKIHACSAVIRPLADSED